MAHVASMQLYKRGIRRRLAPMLNGNMQQLKMAYSLLYSLPGTPVIRSGEEIGMGDDLSLKERLAVRTPMQWDTTANAGFTTGKPFRPIINASIFGYKTVNVASEKRDEQSLLNFIQQIIKLRKAYPEIDNGEWSVINEGQKAVLVMKYTDKGKTIIVAHDFSEYLQEVIFPNNHALKLDGYGFKWLRLN